MKTSSLDLDQLQAIGVTELDVAAAAAIDGGYWQRVVQFIIELAVNAVLSLDEIIAGFRAGLDC